MADLLDLERRLQAAENRLAYFETMPKGYAWGTYTPTLTNTTNVASSTPRLCGYIRVGNNVMVFGVITIDPTAGASTLTQVGCSLPIASALSDALQAGGTFVSTDLFMAGGIESDAANDRVTFTFFPTDLASRHYRFTFGYQII